MVRLRIDAPFQGVGRALALRGIGRESDGQVLPGTEASKLPS